MRLLKSKKGFILSPGDFIHGLWIGMLIGAVLIILITTGVIPFEFGKNLLCKITLKG